ncbi:MAG: glycosyl hydrolase family 17 [Flavobacteriaceae bacterium]|nr:glycosyl hydrolase family 17 [Flavobacteriaceae bacterium]MDA7728260.1 glycosyl hydrolase family 17 [Flavobacteriaceae bacterium]MDA7848682.1 glycosyl hydrolase family 17 [Flavobacteriaceae bacterium]MDG1308977.1 glycosyl hydrolase family 17 [Flavobacteriaceae bacterium]
MSCNESQSKKNKPNDQIQIKVTAKDILGNSNYLAISYGGYRKSSRDFQPTVGELKEDMKILHAMNIRILRTYNVQLAQVSNILKAIRELKNEDPTFEMYLMLGAWIDCLNAWTDRPVNHNVESAQNSEEINRAVTLANEYPDIVKVIAVGNEAMVKWATSYFVQPNIILKWVSHLQALKETGKLSKDIWITSSDNFASWGGGDPQYHTEDLTKLIKAVDYVSVHTYPMHDTHYNPVFWGVFGKETELSSLKRIDIAMNRAKNYAISQHDSVASYIKSLGIKKPIHIGETGWASASNGFYGSKGSKATDEYKEAIFYNNMRQWTDQDNMSCFYFEAFDEPWKDAHNKGGSENYFGLFTVDGKAKYVLWDLVDQGVFDGLTRNGKPITKTYNGNKEALLLEVELPPVKNKL